MEITFFIPSLYNDSSLLNVTHCLLGIYWAVLFTFFWRGPGVYEYLLRGVGAAITPGRVHKLAVSVCAPKLKFYVLYCYDKCVNLSLFYRSIPVQINMGDSCEKKKNNTYFLTYIAINIFLIRFGGGRKCVRGGSNPFLGIFTHLEHKKVHYSRSFSLHFRT